MRPNRQFSVPKLRNRAGRSDRAVRKIGSAEGPFDQDSRPARTSCVVNRRVARRQIHQSGRQVSAVRKGLPFDPGRGRCESSHALNGGPFPVCKDAEEVAVPNDLDDPAYPLDPGKS